MEVVRDALPLQAQETQFQLVIRAIDGVSALAVHYEDHADAA